MSAQIPGSVADLIKRPHHTALCVGDFAAARDFFIDILGFTVEGEIDHRQEPGLAEVVALPGAVVRWGMLVRDHYRIELFKYYEPAGKKDAVRQCDLGYTHMAFEVTDVDAAYARLTEAGYRTTCPPQTLRGGRSKVIYVLAPERNVLELVESPVPPVQAETK